jgi:hypothetical protein
MRHPFSSKKSMLLRAAGVIAYVLMVDSNGAPIDHAKITQVVNEVSVLNPESKESAPAKPEAIFGTPDIMKTGADSRSEMVADDQTVTRVGANTLFSFEPKERVINLKQGSVLFQSPPGHGGGTIRTAAATASVLGTTIIVTVTRAGGFKFLVLEGKGKLTMPNGTVRILHAGQLIVVAPGATMPGPILNFLLRNEVESSLLVVGFNNRLPSWDKIWKEIQQQEKEIADGQLTLPTGGTGTIIDPNTRINQIQGLNANATPTPAANVNPTPASRPTPRVRRRNPNGGNGSTGSGGTGAP